MFDLDRVPIDIECPDCGFYNQILYRDARLRDAHICRGCKQTIRLDDHMNQCRKARAQLRSSLQELEAAIAALNGTLTIKL